MKRIIFILTACLLTVSASAFDTLRLNRHQQAMMKKIEQKHTSKAARIAAKSVESTSQISSIFDYIDFETLDSVVYRANGFNNYKYSIVRDGSKEVSQITEYLVDENMAWDPYCRYDFSRTDAELVVQISYSGDADWEPSTRYTYYDADNKDFYLLQSYENGAWVNTYSRVCQTKECGIVSHIISYYDRGIARVVGRIDYIYHGDKIMKIEYFDDDDNGNLVLVETDNYIYSKSGELIKIESDDWYEGFVYSADKTVSYVFSKADDGTFVMTEYIAYENSSKEYREYTNEEYDMSGVMIYGDYRERVTAEQGYDEIFMDIYYDPALNTEVLEDYIGLIYDSDGRIINLSNIASHNNVLRADRTQLFGYLADGRMKYSRTIDYNGDEINSKVYFYTDSQDDPTDIKNVETEAPIHSNIIYDLTGRIVKDNHHGIFIMNGKKVIR